MNLKALTWSLVLVILACSFSAVSTTSFMTKEEWPPLPSKSSSSSSSSSSTYWSRGPMRNYAVKGSKFVSGSQGQPNLVYTKTNSMPSGDSKTEWSSKTVVTETLTAHNISFEEGGDMIIGTPIFNNIKGMFTYVQPTQYYHIIPSHVILSLQVADRFRYNAVFILGYLLQSPNCKLTLQQYTSLKIIYTALQRRQVQMYRLLPGLIQLRGQSITLQLRTLMFELSKYLPQYYSCSATFWASQIHNNVFNADSVLVNQQDEFDLFTGITDNDIQIIMKDTVDDEMGGYDEASKLTETLLGRVFVKIFKSITVNKLSLTQQLFAIIIRNLPNLDGDAVFEEYVQFIAEIAWRGEISNWEEKEVYQDSIEIYTLIRTMTNRIISDSRVPTIIRYALTYIRDHFVEQQNYILTANEAYRITGGGGLDVTYLLAIISEGEFSYTSIDWKNQLLEFCRTHVVVVQNVLKGMNRYGYTSAKEILLAFLARLRMRLSIEHIEIRRIVYNLLRTVEQKTLIWHVTHITPGHPPTSNGNGTEPNPDIHETPESTTNRYTSTTPRHDTQETPSSHDGYIVTASTSVTQATNRPTDHPTPHEPGSSQPTDSDYSSTTPQTDRPGSNLPTDHPTPHEPVTSEPTDSEYNRTTSQTERPESNLPTDHPTPHKPGSSQPPDSEYTPTTPRNTTPGPNPPTDHPTPHEPGSSQPPDSEYTPTTPRNTTPGPNPPTDHPTPHEPGSSQPPDSEYTPTTPRNTTPGSNPPTDHPTPHEPGSSQPPDSEYTPTTPRNTTPGPNPPTDHPTPHEPGSSQPPDSEYTPTTPRNTTPGSNPPTDHPTPHEPGSSQPPDSEYTPTTPRNTTPGPNPPTDHPTPHEPGSSQPPDSEYTPTTPRNTTPGPNPPTDHPTPHEPGSSQPPDSEYTPTTPRNTTPGSNPPTDHPTPHEPGSSQPPDSEYTPTTPRNTTPGPNPPTDHPTPHEPGSSQPPDSEYTPTTPRNTTPGPNPPTDHPTPHEPGSSQPPDSEYTPTTPRNTTPGPNPPTDHPTPHEPGSSQPPDSEYTPTTPRNTTPVSNPPTDHPTPHEPGSSQPPDSENNATTPRNTTPVSNPPTDHPTSHEPGSSQPTDSGNYTTTPKTNMPGSSLPTDHPPGHESDTSATSPDSTTPQPTVTKYPPTKKPVVPEEVPDLPANINPSISIPIQLTETGVPIFTFDVSSNDSKDALTVPSLTCLQKSPNTKVSEKECDTDTEDYITSHLIEILGKDYIEQVLGSHWEEHYTTKISYLLELLENAQKNPKVTTETKLITIIHRYEIALKSVATYVFLPLIIEELKLDSKVIWSTFDYTNFSTSYIESEKPKDMGPNMITLPVVNPKYWLLPVDVNNPFENFLPDLPADNPDVVKLDSLYKIFRTHEIETLMGKEWNPSVYPNRGALFISVLRTLLTRETVKKNTELYTTIENYLRAVELPSVQTTISETYMKNVVEHYYLVVIKPPLPSEISDIKAVIPETVNPDTKIQVVISDLGVPSIESLTTFEDKLPLKNLVTLPSVTCLQQVPSAGNSPDNCEKDIDIDVTEILTKTFGTNYISVILGDNVEDIYPTRVSLLLALLKKVQTHPKIVNRLESVRIIRRYTTVLKSVASYIFLPLTVTYQKINDVVVWLSYDINNSSQTYIKNTPPVTVDNEIITLPLINPKTWVLPVDVMEPFSGFIPKFSDSESSFAIQIKPLTELIETGRIYELLGPNFRALQFPNRGALHIYVIYTLLTIQEVKIDTQLYTLLQQYVIAIERSSTYVRISENYFETVTHQWQIDQQHIINRIDPVVANVTSRDDILLPALIQPNKDLIVTIKTPSRIFVESSKSFKPVASDFIVLPSVNCLEAFPDEDEDTYCEHFPDLPILHSLIETLGTKGTQKLLEENWSSEYPTMAAFLENLFKKAVQNEKVAKEPTIVAEIETYRMALEYATSYIFLPLLTNYQEIDAELIWLTYDPTDHRQSHMSLHRADEHRRPNIITLPLVNPKVWLQSVNIEHPFSSFIPNLPANDPYAIKIQPLVNLLNSGEILLLLGNNFTPANYPNRGALFLSALRVLLDSKTVQSNKQLYTLVENYFNVIQVVSLYVHIPRTWINNGFTKGTYTWNVDVADLTTALPFPTTKEERQYFYYMQHILQWQNILQMLNIQLPSSSTYKAEFLIMVIKRALASAEFVQMISSEMHAALQYYSAKAELALVASGGVIKWVWAQRIEDRTIQHTRTFDIGKLFTITIPLSRLNSEEAKVHYFKLIKYMHDNPRFLETDDFKYDHYHMLGPFIRAYLKHLMSRPNIDETVKTYIETVVEFIRNTGPGAMLIPSVEKKENH